MGTVFNRGTKDKPNWYVGYRENGEWKYRPSHQPTKALAKRFVQEIEGRIARGQVGIDEPASAPLCGPLIEQFLGGLTNRNADDDRSRGRRHLLVQAIDGLAGSAENGFYAQDRSVKALRRIGWMEGV